MTVLGRTICEVLLLVALGVALGSTANAVRGSGSIKWSKNYFAKDVAELDGQPITQKHSPPRGDREQPAQAALVETAQEVNQPSTVTKLEHNYNSVSFEEVVAILNDPATQDGLNVFIDARAAGSYAEGHIPGAIQCFPFEIEKCIDEVLERAEPADKVVVYCTGGDCEDSIFMCRELIAAGLSMNQVFLYEGGWKEWEDNDQPMEKGR